MKRKLMFLGLFIAASILLTVCGGGGGNSTQTTTGGGGNTQGGGVSEETIAAALADLTPKIEQLMTVQTRPTTSDVSKVLSKVPNVRVLGSTPDGAVWAEIGVNGPHMVIPTITFATNTYNSATDPISIPYPKPLMNTAPGATGMSGQTGRPTSVIARNPTSVPAGAKVLLMSALNSGTYKDPTAEIKSIFSKEDRGYATIDELPGTIENLRKVKGYDVFFFKGHGVLYATFSPYDDKAKAYQNYTITSTNEVDLLHPSPAQYNVDINKRNIVFAYVPVDKNFFNQKVFKWLYGVTAEFVNEYWTFNDDSVVFMNTCYSGSSGTVSAEHFIGTLLSKKVSTYIGWSSAVDSNFADERAKLTFDRLLGANAVQPVLDPPQRPFDRLALVKEMTDRNLKIWPGDNEYPPSELCFYGNTDGFGLLAPSIKKMEVDEKAMRLTLTGIFGKQAGHTLKVTLNNTELPWKSWTEDTIVTELMPEQSGDVVVEINGRKSNPVKLTEWIMTLQYKEVTDAAGSGTLKKNMTFNIRFRADVHGYRELSGKEKPVYPTNIPFFAENTSTATYDGSGSLHIVDTLYDVLSGGGTITKVVQLSKELPPTSGDYLGCEGYIDAENKRLVMYLYGYGTKLTWSQGGTDSVEAGTNALYGSYPGQSEYLPGVYGTAFVIPMSSVFTIQAGAADTGNVAGSSVSLSWSSTVAQSPPLNTDQR